MITPQKTFFVIHTRGDVTDRIMSKLSPRTAADIEEVTLASKDADDITTQALMDDTVQKLCEGLGDISVETVLNPLYIPSSREEIDEVMDAVEGSDNFKFTAMGGNPFIMKSIDVTHDEEQLIQATATCHEFQLPTYSEIIDAQKKARLN